MDDWFVTPSTTVLQLPGNQWIEVKNQFTVGEERDVMKLIVGEVNADGWRKPNVEMVGIAEIACYLVSWSLTRDGRPVPIITDAQKIAALRGLHPNKLKVIEDALRVHIEAQERKSEERKNDQGGVSKSEVTSPSAA